jgi:hypothetical protein
MTNYVAMFGGKLTLRYRTIVLNISTISYQTDQSKVCPLGWTRVALHCEPSIHLFWVHFCSNLLYQLCSWRSFNMGSHKANEINPKETWHIQTRKKTVLPHKQLDCGSTNRSEVKFQCKRSMQTRKNKKKRDATNR